MGPARTFFTTMVVRLGVYNCYALCIYFTYLSERCYISRFLKGYINSR